MIIRKTVPSDFPRVSAIYADARRRMRESGNPTQWGFVWPPEDMIREDCSPEGHGYAVVDDAGRICGVFAFYIGEDETYRVIENGAWLNDEPYGADPSDRLGRRDPRDSPRRRRVVRAVCPEHPDRHPCR